MDDLALANPRLMGPKGLNCNRKVIQTTKLDKASLLEPRRGVPSDFGVREPSPVAQTGGKTPHAREAIENWGRRIGSGETTDPSGSTADFKTSNDQIRKSRGRYN